MNQSHPTNIQNEETQEEIVIQVRDRRKPRQYMIDNMVMDEYLPIIGPMGYAIYSLFVRMSNEKDGERVSASLRMISAHLNIGSNSTLSYYITLLEITELILKDLPEIAIMQGNKRVKKKLGNRSNEYCILPIKPVTPERIKHLKTAVHTSDKLSDDYRTLYLKSLDEWRPIQALWTRPRKKIKTVVGQDALPLNFDEDQGEEPIPPAPATMQDADPTTLEILRQLEITKPSILQQLGQRSPHEALALVFYGRTQSWMESDRLSGYVIKNLGDGGSPAPKAYLELAKAWLAADEDVREGIADCYYQSGPERVMEIFSLSRSAAKAAKKLSSIKDSENYFLEWIDL